MSDAAKFIHAPLGQPGSGRVRYGAAMALFAQGRISADVLEVYRVAAAHDARDPLAELRSRRLPLPDTTVVQPPLSALYTAARDYLLALQHPGSAEVRAALPPDPGPEQTTAPQGNTVVDRWLACALDDLQRDKPALAAAIAKAAGWLRWITYDAYPRDEIGADFADGHAFGPILGLEAPFHATDVELGLFLIAPGVLYRDHLHPAPELYAPLTGPHGWRFGPQRPLMVKSAHEPVWNPSNRPHLTKVGRHPFLCFYVWTGDVQTPARVVAADDWPFLESRQID